MVVLAVAGTALGASDAPAAAGGLGGATVTPDDHLSSGDLVTVTVTGFPADTPVVAVQCDQRVLTTADSGYCNTTILGVLVTGDDGTGSAVFPVTSGALYSSANAKGTCDAQHPCVIALQSQGSNAPVTAAVAGIWFGADSATVARPARRTVRAGQSAEVTVTAASAAVVDRAVDGAPTGMVVVREGHKRLGRAELSGSGDAVLEITLDRGRHRITARYGGDRNYLPSADHVTVVVRK